MLRATLLAEPGAGSSTFVGLLYLAQTRLTTQRPEAFRFAPPPESLQLLTPLYTQLMTGEFPAAVADADVARVRFQLAFDRTRGGKLWHRRTGFEPDDRVELRWVRSAFPSIASLLEAGRGDPHLVDALVGCTAPIFLVDPPTTASAVGSTPATGASRDDSIVAILRELGSAGGAAWRTAGQRIHPIVVCSRLDAWATDVLPGVPKGTLVDRISRADEREHVATALLETVAARTLAFCRSNAARFEEPTPFVSYVRPISGADGAPGRLALQELLDHRQEPVYPFEEFRTLIERLGALARNGA